MKHMQDCYTLQNGVLIPRMAFGTYKTAEGDGTAVIRTAIEAGYRSFDTASFYGTEACLGQAIRESGVPREAFFVTSKVWKTEMGYAGTKAAFQRSLERLKMSYLDLYLIPWPRPSLEEPDWRTLDSETWRAMEELYRAGKVRAIGVSNFLPHHMENLLQRGTIAPMAAQLEYHPGYIQAAAVQYCRERQIQVQAWSPMGRGRVLQDPLLLEMADRYQVSPAQICLRFTVQEGVIPLPKASTMERMRENLDIFSFAITQEDMYRLETMPQIGWSGEHPDRERVYFQVRQ